MLETLVQDQQAKVFTGFLTMLCEKWLANDMLKLLTVLIAGIIRGGLSYTPLPFVGLVSHFKEASAQVAPILVKNPLVLPLMANKLYGAKMVVLLHTEWPFWSFV